MSQLIQPRLSEKTYAVAEALNVYTFEVPANFNKNQIKTSRRSRLPSQCG